MGTIQVTALSLYLYCNTPHISLIRLFSSPKVLHEFGIVYYTTHHVVNEISKNIVGTYA